METIPPRPQLVKAVAGVVAVRIVRAMTRVLQPRQPQRTARPTAIPGPPARQSARRFRHRGTAIGWCRREDVAGPHTPCPRESEKPGDASNRATSSATASALRAGVCSTGMPAAVAPGCRRCWTPRVAAPARQTPAETPGHRPSHFPTTRTSATAVIRQLATRRCRLQC